MADSCFSLNTLLGWLKGFLNQMPSPVSGFDILDAKVKEKGDVFSSLFSFDGANLKDTNGNDITDVNGNPIQLNVLLQVLNFKKAMQPIFKGINSLNPDNVGQESELLTCLLGKNRPDFNFADEQKDEEGNAIENTGTTDGLLGVKLIQGGNIVEANYKKVWNYAGKQWSWEKIANDYLSYGLECKAEGQQYGGIQNQSLDKCGGLISEYLVKVGVIADESEVQVDVMTLVSPLLARMQAYLVDYYTSAIEKYIKQGKYNKPTEDENEAEFEDLVENEPDEDAQADAIDNTFGEGGINNAKQISVTLHKITGTSEIKMTAIKANYSPSTVLDDMEELLEQDEFINTLTEEPQTYTINIDDDGFDIDRCEGCQECDPCESLGEALKAAIQAYRNLYIVHWLSSGNDMMKTHLLAEEMYGQLIQEIDTLGELMVEKCGNIIDPNFPCEYIEVKPFEFQESLDVIKSLIQPYIDAIDFAYCNQDSDVQSVFDEWLRYWKKQLNYFVKGQAV
jgi:hypothetical protein